MNKFYVYAYLRNPPSESGIIDDPYYIGKGSGNRIATKAKNEVHPPKDKNYRQVIAKNLDEQTAIRLEVFLIKLYGRKDLGTGCLRNRTDGADGTSGAIKSVAERNLRSILAKTRWTDPTMRQRYIAAIKKSWDNQERRKQAAKRMSGRSLSKHTKKLMSERKAGYIPWNKGKKTGFSWNKGITTGLPAWNKGIAPKRIRAFDLFNKGMSSKQVADLMGVELGTAQFYAWKWRKERKNRR